MIAKRCILIICLSVISWQAAISQSTYTPFSQISNPVLNQNNVYDIVQDKTGFLWLGTYNGLYRYDGYTFKSYQGNPLDTNSLFIGPVKDICLDDSGNLWLNILGAGIAHMNTGSGKITRYRYNPAVSNSPHSATISDMKLDKNGDLWMSSYSNGICKRDNRKGIFIHYPKNTRGLPNEAMASVHCSEDGNLWFGSTEGLYHYDPSRESFSRIDTEKQIFTALLFDKSGDIWVGASHGLFLIPANEKKYNSIVRITSGLQAFKELGVTSILRDRQGKIWIGTASNGLLVYDDQTKDIIQFTNDPLNPNSIRSNFVNTVFEDENGNIWIACSNGLSKISPFQRAVNLYSSIKDTRPADRIKNVRAIHKDSAGIWIGTAGEGLLHLTSRGEILKHTFRPGLESCNYINQILPDGKNNLLLATANGIQVFNLKKGKADAYYSLKPATGRNRDAVWSLFLLNDENLLIGTKEQGLICLNLKTKTYIHYSIKERFSGNSELSVWHIHRDKKGRIWLGTSRGLAEFDPARRGSEINFISPRSGEFPGSNIFHIHEDASGILWLAFVDGGLVKYDAGSGTARYFSTLDGLPSNVVCSILANEEHNLWISTTSGLCVFNTKENRITQRYTESDGLQSNHFYFKSCDRNSAELLFGGMNGITAFYPEKLPAVSKPPRVFLTAFKLLYNDVEGVQFGSSLTVPYDQNTFTFQFASSDLTNPEKNQFAYQLLGETKGWIHLKDQHYLAFNSLSPGIYTILVKAANAKGEWGPVSRLEVTIKPPYWRSWWFALICLFVILGILYFIGMQIYKRRDAQRQQVISELAALRSQLNPHFIFNSLGSLQHFIISNEKNLALEYLSKFSRMMRMILEYSTQETITLEEEISFLHIYMYMESARTDHTVTFEIDSDYIERPDTVYIPPMLTQPLIENAIKHGLVTKRKGGKITVKFTISNGYLLCEVEDNGFGRKASEAHKPPGTKSSMALKIISERLSMLTGDNGLRGSLNIIDKENKDGEPAGTLVLLKVPYITHLTNNKVYA